VILFALSRLYSGYLTGEEKEGVKSNHRGDTMKKARLIKKAELAEQKTSAHPARQASTSRQALTGLTQRTLQQWVGAHRDSRRQNPRAAFAALFAAEA
jgi:hypothetical protein